MAEVDRSSNVPPSTVGYEATQLREMSRSTAAMGATATTQARNLTPEDPFVRRGSQ